jgi:hypothetical protein
MSLVQMLLNGLELPTEIVCRLVKVLGKNVLTTEWVILCSEQRIIELGTSAGNDLTEKRMTLSMTGASEVVQL